ncbi:MAG: DEAD/DEAH box helicase [Acidobacteriales bacterium]|nr:DEAD/DEAH box helicase [Terriglobales bacterium]
MPKKRLKPETDLDEDVLRLFHPAVQQWFRAVFDAPTRPQQMGWPAIARGESTLILAPTGTGKTLTAFLWCLNRLMFSPPPKPDARCRVLYISPIKALTVDVERNLRAPLVGISQAAQELSARFHAVEVASRTGDTSPAERARFARKPADILITTPESLYLLLTSAAREALRSIETVIVDEIHALVPGKRGTHLALSLERLEHFCGRPLQRIGLSATQRPLEEVARYLSGAQSAGTALAAEDDEARGAVYRPLTIVDASEKKRLDLRIEVPVEDMAKLHELTAIPSGAASQGPVRPSIWSAIHPKLLELVRAHTSTIIFVNSRRLAERISGAINELAGETLVRAHHGSVAVAQRKEIEERLKMGTLRGIVATSSLELGIDMGAVDLVVQVEAPPSVASGMQRIGRASHNVGGTSKGIIFPKFRADLLACAAVTRAMYEGQVEAVRYPRNPLDVLAQQLVALTAMDDWKVDDAFALVQRAAPYAGLTRAAFEGVLDMLSGRYPSDEFAELRPRITWDRVANTITAREGARHVAVVNSGTIADRGLYGVFLAGAKSGARVGELDEEMVFESRTGDTIVLGASTWRIEEITHDRVLVSPAPGEPGKMPFWHGDTGGRPAEFGAHIGKLTRELLELPRATAFHILASEHSLDEKSAENLLAYLEEQRAATERVPSDRDILIERCRDELGDWRLCVLSPFGSRVHAPWCMAVTARLRAERGLEAESMWSDDGFVIRLPESEDALDSEALLPRSTELRDLLLRQLGSTSLFAAKFREAAARALLLPKRRPGKRAPLWQQRKRAADLLAVTARYEGFPILLETYRECLRDVFDVPAAIEVLRGIERGEIHTSTIDSVKPSPFASSLLFSYVANYIYDGDAPLAERRAQALSIDQSQLQELLGDTDLRELLDPNAIDEVEAQLQMRDPEMLAKHTDAVHDLLLRLGDLSSSELEQRAEPDVASAAIAQLVTSRRALKIRVAGEERHIAVEDAGRYRDALGIPMPPGIAEAYLTKSDSPLLELVRRYARRHGPFTSAEIAARFRVSAAQLEPLLQTLHAQGRLFEGEFRPGGTHREWCDAEVLRMIRQRSLSRLRKQIAPVAQQTFVRFSTRWQGVHTQRRGPEALLDAVEALQGAALPVSELEREILPSRVLNYRPEDLDQLMASGQVAWVGVERIGDRDGRVALYLTQSLPLLLPPASIKPAPALSERAQQIVSTLQQKGALFFPALHTECGGGFPGETKDALWELVWAGLATNDTFHSLRNLRSGGKDDPRKVTANGRAGSPEFLLRFRSRYNSPREGRWSLVSARNEQDLTPTEWSANIAQQLLVRYGIVMRETAVAEDIPGGYSAAYPALKQMEESGWIRRGMFVEGLGAAQFAMPAAVDLLRSLRRQPDDAKPEAIFLAAADPANPFGTLLPWPREEEQAQHGLARAAGASVVLVDGTLAAYLRRNNPALRVWLPEEEPDHSRYSRALAAELARMALRIQQRSKYGLLIAEINGAPASAHPLCRFLIEAGFVETALGLQMRRPSRAASLETQDDVADSEEDRVETS